MSEVVQMSNDAEDDGEDWVRTTVTMPESLREAAKRNSEHGEISERVREIFREIAYGEDIAEHERKKKELKEVRQRKDEIRNEISSLQAELEEVERKEMRLEAEVEQSQAEEQQFETIVETLEAELYDGANITEKRRSVHNAAEIKGMEPSEVVEYIKERNPKVPDYAFKPPRETDESWFGLDA